MADSLDMVAAVRALPEQFARAISAPDPLLGHQLVEQHTSAPGAEKAITSVLVAGMGGSGIAGDLVRAVVSPGSPVPIVTIKSDECPGFVGRNSLVVVSSFSGATAESLSIASEAIERGALVVAVSTGGRLAELADAAGMPLWLIEDEIPCPRAGLAALAVPVLRTFDDFGLFRPTAGGSLAEHLDATLNQLRRRRDGLITEDNEAIRLARRIGRTIPLVYGAGMLGKAAAVRWKSQFNENPKVPAYYGVAPELTHNEICGWAQHGDMTRQVLTLVALRHSYEGERNAAAMDLVAEITEEVVAGVHEIAAEGTFPLAQFFDLVMMGDFVSLHMALAEGIDPGPVPVLDQIKARLG